MISVPHKVLGDMSLENIAGSVYQSAMVKDFGGNSRRVYYTEEETFFQDGEKICSCTDPEGYITMANSAFVRLSGYSKKELIGLPHSVLRHPDMPAVAFKEMWITLASQGRWQGYVKNLRKDGGFYWVHANIFSNFRNGRLVGYTSARVAVPRDKVAFYSAKYAEWLSKEQKQGLGAA